jgi:hypothetical protein
MASYCAWVDGLATRSVNHEWLRATAKPWRSGRSPAPPFAAGASNMMPPSVELSKAPTCSPHRRQFGQVEMYKLKAVSIASCSSATFQVAKPGAESSTTLAPPV